MKIKIPKIKTFQILAYSKYFYGVLGIAIIVVGVFMSIFIDKNFYQTITQSQEIILLKKEVAPDSINLKKVDEVISLLDNKTKKSQDDLEAIKNPFSVMAVTVPAPAVTPPDVPTSTTPKI